MKFTDLFSAHAMAYAANRPQYPAEFFQYLAGLCVHHDLAWDCATGNGQAAIQLAKLFERVIATDASEQQLSYASVADNIDYQLAKAEQSPLGDKQAALICVAQAAHWFELDKFYREVKRVLQPTGVVAIFGYNRAVTGNLSIDKLYNEFCYDYLWQKSCWDMARDILNNGYNAIDFPFEEIKIPEFHISMNWGRENYIDYLNTWSAVKNHQKRYQENPVTTIIGKRSIIPIYPSH